MSETIEPDPSYIGGVAKAPFAYAPTPVALFQTRARRFAFLAGSSTLGPYLAFLGELSRLQARLAVTLPPVQPLSPDRLAAARSGAMPPIDRGAQVADPAMAATLDALCAGAMELEMPEQARLALTAVRAAPEPDRYWLLANVLSDEIPEDSVAPHLFAAAAVQVHMARLAATLDPEEQLPVGNGICPSCGGRPLASVVKATPGVENVRYATCACCATQWNEVRVKCLCCGSTKGISYRSADTTEATVKAESCSDCGSWVKILYQTKNPSLDPVADDVFSLGLDVLMRDAGSKRGGFNPFLIGY